ncbi:MAG: S8 family serine peptidase [Bdellovibrionota bacterium]
MKLFFLFSLLLAAPAAFAGALPVEAKYEEALWNLRNYGQPFRIDPDKSGKPGKAGADIKILDAWKIQSTAPDVVVAVIDGAFDLDHPDLLGEFDTRDAYDFLRGRAEISPPAKSEFASHGTMVSGVIGANGLNKIGITGIARQIKLLPLEAIPEKGDENDATVARAIRYAADRGARLINCSFGKYYTHDDVRDAIAYARDRNVLIVAGSGNDGKNIAQAPFWPASYSADFDNVISVAATDRRDDLWAPSNFGSSVDIAAPGDEILTTGSPHKDIQIYSSFSGTSAAAPHVAAVAALMIERNPALKAGEIKKILLASSDKLPALAKKTRSGGRLNAARALEMATAPALTAEAAAEPCSFDKEKEIIVKAKTGYSATWTISASPALLAPYASQDKNLQDYRTWFTSKTPWTAQDILQNNVRMIREALEGIKPGDSFLVQGQRDIRNVERIIRGEIGKIRPMNCLESIPFREFLKAVDLRKHPVEMSSVTLKKGDQLKVLGDFYYEPGSDADGAVGTESSAATIALQRKLMKEGWALYTHLHNHPFDFRNEDIGGEVAPSNPDIDTYRHEHPESAVITNGRDTIEMTPDDYNKKLEL